MHRTKTIAQQALRDADERARLARADVAHFQNQVAAALGQRDEALLEADQAKERCEKALGECEAARERCEKGLEERDHLGKELAELKAEVGRFLQEGGVNGSATCPPEASEGVASGKACQNCRKGLSQAKEEQGENESVVIDEALSEEEDDTASEGSFEEESENEGGSQEGASERGEESDRGLEVRKEMPREGFGVEDHEAERRVMQERVESLEEQLQLVMEERESLKRALEVSRREEEKEGSERVAEGEVDEAQRGGNDSWRDVETQTGKAADAPELENTEFGIRDSSKTVLGKETQPEAESEVERGERERVPAEAMPRVNFLDVDVEHVGLLGASSALQAQLSQLLNDPGVASEIGKSADRVIANQDLSESATSSVESRMLDLSLSSTHPSEPPRPNKVIDLDNPVNPNTNAPVNTSKSSESTSGQPPNPSATGSNKPPDSGKSQLGDLPNFGGLSANPGEEFDVRRALAQAAQEKVAALVLLSQQEERHEMEVRQTLNLHARLGEAQERLAVVAKEKVAALLEVAQLREEVENLKDSERWGVTMKSFQVLDSFLQGARLQSCNFEASQLCVGPKLVGRSDVMRRTKRRWSSATDIET